MEFEKSNNMSKEDKKESKPNISKLKEDFDSIYCDDYYEERLENISDNEEFKLFSKDCEEWEDEIYDQVYYEDNELAKVTYPFMPISNKKSIAKKEEYKMYNLGSVFQKQDKQKLKKSFRYFKSPPEIFCRYLVENKPCPKNCKEIHDFDNIPLCRKNCNRITYKNNFYLGVCNKKHQDETFDNYMLRKSIKLKNINSVKLEFFEMPEDEELRNILNICKKLKYNEIELVIIPKKETLDIEDYYSNQVEIE